MTFDLVLISMIPVTDWYEMCGWTQGGVFEILLLSLWLPLLQLSDETTLPLVEVRCIII